MRIGAIALKALLGFAVCLSATVSALQMPPFPAASDPSVVDVDSLSYLTEKDVEDYFNSKQQQHLRGNTFEENEEFKQFEEEEPIFGASSKTESTHVNIWTKLKESLGKTIVGIILIVVMPCLLWKNEGRHVREMKRIGFCETATTIDPKAASEDHVGELVHFAGRVMVDGASLSSGDGFGVSVPGAVALKRTCYIYQRIEESHTSVQQDRIGGGETRTTEYTVKEDWVREPQPEQLPNLPEETNSHGIWSSIIDAANGTAQNEVITKVAHVGDFKLPSKIIEENPYRFKTEWNPVPAEFLPESLERCEGLTGGQDHILKTYEPAKGPQNGDCKVVFEYVAEDFPCSFVVKQTLQKYSEEPLLEGESNYRFSVDKCDVVSEGCFSCLDGDLGEIWLVQSGDYNLEEMIENAEAEEKTLLNIIRVIGWVLLVLGWSLLFSPFITALSVLPFLAKLGGFAAVLVGIILGCTCCCIVVASAWVRYRPLLGLAMLAIAGTVTGVVIWRLNVAAETGGTA
mmetsp:Transcript_52722/g.78161  ORF Transcript_52722/g.78161 Transcript_52722/m.78161 type:complete len:515 (+) Transcript_52722:80-1624(+)|eukprot:CAMPEP_0195539646 /NCGR_PEP_ID=MMETSP0794_2-20130614/50163_1 /TAXON_ID=515487 /ORGANISM="Stephanopyxis turris, Strain CCMP 815" /LENGTH=514 /DNA_ID=CAMNT_0040673687 /DNA_START=78 /DNA_END=1622 /DNA_ORIENTATION=-